MSWRESGQPLTGWSAAEQRGLTPGTHAQCHLLQPHLHSVPQGTTHRLGQTSQPRRSLRTFSHDGRQVPIPRTFTVADTERPWCH